MGRVSDIVKASEIRSSLNESDTIRLWESHRDQAVLWRSLTLIQVPITLLALVLALLLWSTRSVTLNVPAKPLPGIYAAQDIPDSEFIDFATDYINLIATYQPGVARRQFDEARRMLWGQMIQAYDADMMGTELRAIENTKRTQIFFVDPTKIGITRDGRTVTVTLSGDRYKIIAGKEMPAVRTEFAVTLNTIPRNKFNPYGIVITNVALKNLD